jgi:hypothetical protein
MASLFNWGSSSSATVAVPTTPQDARESFGGESYGRASFSMTSSHSPGDDDSALPPHTPPGCGGESGISSSGDGAGTDAELMGPRCESQEDLFSVDFGGLFHPPGESPRRGDDAARHSPFTPSGSSSASGRGEQAARRLDLPGSGDEEEAAVTNDDGDDDGTNGVGRHRVRTAEEETATPRGPLSTRPPLCGSLPRSIPGSAARGGGGRGGGGRPSASANTSAGRPVPLAGGGGEEASAGGTMALAPPTQQQQQQQLLLPPPPQPQQRRDSLGGTSSDGGGGDPNLSRESSQASLLGLSISPVIIDHNWTQVGAGGGAGGLGLQQLQEVADEDSPPAGGGRVTGTRSSSSDGAPFSPYHRQGAMRRRTAAAAAAAADEHAKLLPAEMVLHSVGGVEWLRPEQDEEMRRGLSPRAVGSASGGSGSSRAGGGGGGGCLGVDLRARGALHLTDFRVGWCAAPSREPIRYTCWLPCHSIDSLAEETLPACASFDAGGGGGGSGCALRLSAKDGRLLRFGLPGVAALRTLLGQITGSADRKKAVILCASSSSSSEGGAVPRPFLFERCGASLGGGRGWAYELCGWRDFQRQGRRAVSILEAVHSD